MLLPQLVYLRGARRVTSSSPTTFSGAWLLCCYHSCCFRVCVYICVCMCVCVCVCACVCVRVSPPAHTHTYTHTHTHTRARARTHLSHVQVQHDAKRWPYTCVPLCLYGQITHPCSLTSTVHVPGDTSFVSIHFTLGYYPKEAHKCVHDIERTLAKYNARPHWGKLWHTTYDTHLFTKYSAFNSAFPPFCLHSTSLFCVVSRTWSIPPCKYRRVLEVLLKLMKVCGIMGGRPVHLYPKAADFKVPPLGLNIPACPTTCPFYEVVALPRCLLL